jgi:hypothetical protein
MTYAALIAAYQEAPDGEAGLRALLPMAGRTLIEHQIRRAAAAGASHAVVLVERLPAELNVALDRLRRDGIPVNLARSAVEAADHFHPEETVLLIADGLVAASDCFEAMAARTSPTLLVVSDIPENERFERIDADYRWAGLALTNVQQLQETAEMLGDWDLQSTLMRRIVQSGVDFLPVDGEAGAVVEAREAVVLAEHGNRSRDAGHAMLERNTDRSESWPGRFVYSWLVSALTPFLLDRRAEPLWLRVAALVLTLGGAGALWFGWFWTAVAVLLIAGPIDSIAGRIDLAQLRDRHGSGPIQFAKAFAQGLAVLASGRWAATQTGDWAYWLLAVVAILLLVLAEREMANLRRLSAKLPSYAACLADGNAAIWTLPIFAMTGLVTYWPISIAGYAVVSLIVMQELMNRSIDAQK